MDPKFFGYLRITQRTEEGVAIDVEEAMKSGESFDFVMSEIDKDLALPDMRGFAKSERSKGRTADEIMAQVAATIKGKDAAFMLAFRELLK